MKPRVLFVSRERFRLPLDGLQKRKWDAVSVVVDVRVLAAAPEGWPTGDERFHLEPPARPRILDGALHYLRLPWTIARELRRFRPDAALVQGVHETVAFLIARRLTGSPVKIILDVQGDWRMTTRLYGSRWRRLLNPLNDALAPIAIRHADAVRTISKSTTELVRRLGVEPAATFPPFVDAGLFASRPPLPLGNQPVALFVGVLDQSKNVDGLAHAWRVVAEQLPDARLRLVGEGARADVAEGLVRDYGARWDRRLTADEIGAALDESWLLTLPSRTEGLGRVLVEAACRGRALVGADRGGIPEIVRHEENGLLVDPDDPEAIAAALVRILGDRAVAAQMGDAARRTGDEWSVTPDAYAARVEALVRGVLAG